MKKTILIAAILSTCIGVTKASISVEIRKIDSVSYFALKEKTNLQNQKVELQKITDLEQIRQTFKDFLIWGSWSDTTKSFVVDNNGSAVLKIAFRNGKTDFVDDGFGVYKPTVTYYQEEDILTLEGEMFNAESFNLTSGRQTENPQFFIFSSSRKFRLNGREAPEGAYHFIEEKIDGEYQEVVSIFDEFEKKEGFGLYFVLDAFWESDSVLNVITTIYPGQFENLYYQVILK